MGDKIRIKDIAEKANVSTGTVDRVLHNRGEVNAETRNKVMAIVNDLGYVPNLLAKSLGSKKITNIAVLLPVADSEHAYWQMPLKGVELAAEELKDFNTQIQIVHFDPANPESFSKNFEEVLLQEPDGIIFSPVFESLSLEFAKRCTSLGIPLACLEINLVGEDAIAYFGQDAVGSGVLSGKLMEQILPPDSSILLLNLARKMTITPHLRRRARGINTYFENPTFKKGINIRSIDLDIQDQKLLRDTLLNALKADDEIKGIYVTSSQVHRVAKSLSRIGREDILLIGHDLLEENIDYLEKGIIDFLIGHKPEENGYKSVMALFNHVHGVGSIETVNLSPIDIIMKENITYYKIKRTFVK